MSATIRFSDIERMLEKCAPGYTWRRSTHSRVIKVNGKTYPTMPKFDEIELGHIRKMARYFQIMDCAKKHLPQL